MLSRPAGEGPVAWETTIEATSPETVEYTPYSGIDTGPSQADVHLATLKELEKAVAPVFSYGP